MSLPYGHTTKTVRPRTLPCVSSTIAEALVSVAHELYVSSALPKDCFRPVLLAFLPLSRRIASVAHGCVFLPRLPKLSFPLHTLHVPSTFPKDRFRPVRLAFLLHSRRSTSVAHGCVFLPHSRRSVSVAHGCVVLPRSRRTASVAYGRVFLQRLRRVVSVAHGCTFLPHSRRIASVPYALRFVRNPEGFFPSRTAPLPFCRRSEEHRQCVENRFASPVMRSTSFPEIGRSRLRFYPWSNRLSSRRSRI